MKDTSLHPHVIPCSRKKYSCAECVTRQVSEWRKGRVIDLDEQNKVLTVEPWPDSSVHPLTGPRQPSPTGHETWSELDALQPVRCIRTLNFVAASLHGPL